MLLDALPAALTHAAGFLVPALLVGIALGAGLAGLTAPRPDAALAEAIGTLPLSRRQRVRHVRLPAVLPRMFAGARFQRERPAVLAVTTDPAVASALTGEESENHPRGRRVVA